MVVMLVIAGGFVLVSMWKKSKGYRYLDSVRRRRKIDAN